MQSADQRALFRKVDCVRIRVPDIATGIAFYQDQLGHQVIWRFGNAAGLRMPEADTEIVLHTDDEGFEVDLMVSSADEAAQRIIAAGGSVVVRDPWGTELVLLDTTRGLFQPDATGQVSSPPGSN